VPIPDASDIVVPDDKLVRFLLVADHPQNKGRAPLLIRLGYDHENWHLLANDLVTIAHDSDRSRLRRSRSGVPVWPPLPDRWRAQWTSGQSTLAHHLGDTSRRDGSIFRKRVS
jgi:hypothetical protein